MKKTSLSLILTFILMVGCWSCSENADENITQVELKPVTGDASDKGIETSLFDGFSLNGWHDFNKTGAVKGWRIEDSALVCGNAASNSVGSDIISDNEYEDFELSWEWKTAKGGRGGIMYHVVESPKYTGANETGPMYQLVDDQVFRRLEDAQKSGADNAMHFANNLKKLMQVGEWNLSKIIFSKGHVEHWLNGKKILEFQAWDEAWFKKKKIGKLKDYADYGIARKGHIALQDGGSKIYFKHITITSL